MTIEKVLACLQNSSKQLVKLYIYIVFNDEST